MSRPRRPYRPGLWVWFAYAFGAFVVVGSIVLVVALLVGEEEGGVPLGRRLGGTALVVGFAAPFLVCLYRMARVGVFVDEREVTIRTVVPWRTTVVPWRDVLAFELGQWMPPLRMGRARAPIAAVRVVLADGRSILVRELSRQSAAVWLGSSPAAIVHRLDASRPPPVGTW